MGRRGNNNSSRVGREAEVWGLVCDDSQSRLVLLENWEVKFLSDIAVRYEQIPFNAFET